MRPIVRDCHLGAPHSFSLPSVVPSVGGGGSTEVTTKITNKARRRRKGNSKKRQISSESIYHYNMPGATENLKGTVVRKPRRSGWSKVARKYGIQLSGMILPTLR